ncbi:uncharacterized protein EKO05_0007498 [Ascochyta rabiei]|uniref:uncharacterized protein n=1 Tax=Didymella rabiei TaxID=5454 RepID=UPI002204767A|nr:uncharacterized protein EKO05_0007498 [Ascochyta rabiei]UPX17122.1 hypothetical protein EKO05_0007498 [Ascochyta rabiei]
MVHKKPAVTAKVLQALLIRIGSASSGTKSTLLARFQRKIQQPGVFHRPSEGGKQPRKPWNRKLRVMSIDMGIKNLAFCDAEVTYSATESASEPNLGATMNVLRWKKIDLVGSAYNNKDHLLPEKGQEVMESTEDDADPYSPSVLSKTAHRLITEEVLSTSPDIILIEKQRWRSGGGSAVQQWTVRVNTLEAMLWAILETLKAAPPHQGTNAAKPKHDYNVYAIDPKRVGQYWLSGHARALRERRNEATPAPNASTPQSPPSQDKSRDKARTTTRPNKKQPSRARAEKAAKINILRSWLSPPPCPQSHPHPP